MPFAHDYERKIEVLSWNSSRGHQFYIVTVQSEGDLLYLAVLPGHLRWNKKLAHALVGGGFFITEQYARDKADELCEIYKDFDPAQVEIKLLDISEAISCLSAAAEEERNKKPNAYSSY